LWTHERKSYLYIVINYSNNNYKCSYFKIMIDGILHIIKNYLFVVNFQIRGVWIGTRVRPPKKGFNIFLLLLMFLYNGGF